MTFYLHIRYSQDNLIKTNNINKSTLLDSYNDMSKEKLSPSFVFSSSLFLSTAVEKFSLSISGKSSSLISLFGFFFILWLLDLSMLTLPSLYNFLFCVFCFSKLKVKDFLVILLHPLPEVLLPLLEVSLWRLNKKSWISWMLPLLKLLKFLAYIQKSQK